MSPPDLAETSALLRETFPGAPQSTSRYLEWLYRDSPFGEVIDTNLDDDQGRAGHYAVVPIALCADRLSHPGALSLNTAVASRARGGGVFVTLASQTIDQAARRGVETVLGVANANSTPGFVRRLGFELLTSLPANILIPRLGRDRWAAAGASSDEGRAWVAGSAELLDAPAPGLARCWTPATLAWRLRCPGRRYVVHRSSAGLAVSILDRRGPVPVAVLLKVFALGPLDGRALAGLVRSVASAHRAPAVLHVGLNDALDPRGLPLPERLRPSPLNLIRRDLTSAVSTVAVTRWEFLDFDAY